MPHFLLYIPFLGPYGNLFRGVKWRKKNFETVQVEDDEKIFSAVMMSIVRTSKI